MALTDDGKISRIDNCECRRIVPSTRDSWYHCGSTEGDHPPPTEGGEEQARDAAADKEGMGARTTEVDESVEADGPKGPDAADAPKPPGRTRRRRAAGGNP